MKSIPTRGMAKDDVLSALEGYRSADVPWRDGRTFGYVYDAGLEVESVAKAAFTAYAPDFLKRVWQARDVQVFLSPLAHSVFPSAFDRPGSFTVRYQGDAPLSATDLALELRYLLEGRGNTLAVTCSFDGGPARQELRELVGNPPRSCDQGDHKI